MAENDVIDRLGEPDAVIPKRLAMTSTTWLCSTCKKLHEFDALVPIPTPCSCGGIFFEKKVRVLQ